MNFLGKIADKTVKPLGRLGTNKVKTQVHVSIMQLEISAAKHAYVKPQIKRGNKKNVDLRVIRVQPTQSVETVQLPSNTTPIESSIYIKDGAPEPKLCKVSFNVTDSQGND